MGHPILSSMDSTSKLHGTGIYSWMRGGRKCLLVDPDVGLYKVICIFTFLSCTARSKSVDSSPVFRVHSFLRVHCFTGFRGRFPCKQLSSFSSEEGWSHGHMSHEITFDWGL